MNRTMLRTADEERCKREVHGQACSWATTDKCGVRIESFYVTVAKQRLCTQSEKSSALVLAMRMSANLELLQQSCGVSPPLPLYLHVSVGSNTP